MIDLRKRDILILIFISVGLVSILLFTYYTVNKSASNKLKKNRANTYSSVYITNDKQASIYLSNYYNLINNDIDEAYALLNPGIKQKMTLNEFKIYVSQRDFSLSKIQKFRFYSKKGKDYYDIYDINNNHILFKTDGIMQYRVIIYD